MPLLSVDHERDFEGKVRVHFKEMVILWAGNMKINLLAEDSVRVAGGEIKARNVKHSWLYPKEKALADW